jgi:glycine/serine hydroxymethyltransferase
MKEPEMREIASLIDAIIKNPMDIKVLKAVKKKVEAIIEKFPLYEDLIEELEDL